MKNSKIEVLVIRVNGKVVDFEGINDHYTIVQLSVKKEDLDVEALEYLKNEQYVTEYEDSFYLGENEAKDCYLEVGNLSIQMETPKVKFD